MDDEEDYGESPENGHMMKSDIVEAAGVKQKDKELTENKKNIKEFCRETDSPACISRYNQI